MNFDLGRYVVERVSILHVQGRIQDFHLGGGGGAKDYARARTSWAQNPKSLIIIRPGSRAGPLKGPGSSRGFDALSCYLSLICKHSDTKWEGGGGKHSRSNFRGACCAPPPPLNPPLLCLSGVCIFACSLIPRESSIAISHNYYSPLQATWQGPIWIWWPCLSLCFPAASVSTSLSCSYPISVWPLTPLAVLLLVGSVDTREEKDNVWCKSQNILKSFRYFCTMK